MEGFTKTTMAEISESSNDTPETAEKAQAAAADFDSDSMRRTKPGLKRLILTLSVLFSFIAGFPFFWKSIEIYRAPLPFRDIDSLSTQIEANPILFPCRFQAVFIGFSSNLNPNDLKLSVLKQITTFTSTSPQCGTCSDYTVSVTIQSDSHCLQTQNDQPSCLYHCGTIKAVDFDSEMESVDDLLDSSLKVCAGLGGKVCTVVVVNKDEDVKIVVGKYRHAWVVGRISEADATAKVAEIFVKMFVNGGKKEGLIHAEFMPVGADGKMVLSFNLLNADSRDLVYDWDFQGIEETLLAPIIEALGPVAKIIVESQVLHHTPKSAFSYWDDKRGSYVLNFKDLSFFVNSNEWHLDTSIGADGRSKILQFVVYVPSANECPLLLELPNGEISKTNGFISPMWGGVIVWNPQGCLKTIGSQHPPRHTISPQDLQKVFEVFMAQLRQLFGLKSDDTYTGATGTFNLLASERAFTEWELDVLSRQHTCFNIHSCATTLGSLSKLVQSLPRMIIMDEIGKQVKFSLEAASLAQSNASLGVSDASAVSSRKARSLAEDAFFHPSIMSVSYYSFEHCFAVYSPFFLPVSLHVLLAALRECRRFKQEKHKYLAWKAKVE